MNGYYPAAETLTLHLFYSCSITLQFWQNLNNWLGIKIENVLTILHTLNINIQR